MKFAAAAITPGRANIVQYGTEPSAKSTQSGLLFGSPHSRASAWPGAAAKSANEPQATTSEPLHVGVKATYPLARGTHYGPV